MKAYYVKCRRDIENIDPKMVRTKNNRLIMQENALFAELKSQDF